MEYTTMLPPFDPAALVVELDAEKAKSLRSFYPRISKSLFFPDYFGKNLDALFDCLGDLSGIPGQHTTIQLVIRNATHFLEKEKVEKREAVLQILKDAALPENRYDNLVFQTYFIA
jgi:RNAse (barnase) inhibitor barstar